MLGDLRVSLYELFGNLVPGTVMLTAVVTAVWAFFYSDIPLAMDRLIALPWYVSLILAYLAGVLAQGLASQAEDRLDGGPLLNLSESGFDPELQLLVTRARDLLKTEAGLDFSKSDPDWLFRACDEALAQSDRTPDRETYRYREGLFRGLAMSFFALAGAITARALLPGAALQVDGAIEPLSRGVLLTISAIALITSVLCFLRFRNIRTKRFARAITGFIMLRTTDNAAAPS